MMWNLLALLANTKVAFYGDDEILRPHGSSDQFTIRSYCKRCIKGPINFVFQLRQFGTLRAKAPTKAFFSFLKLGLPPKERLQ